MRPHLIVDFRERSLFALVITGDGEISPCTFEANGVSTRYLSSDVWLDPEAVENGARDWKHAASLLGRANARTFFAKARRLGARRPWDLGLGARALRLSDPLRVLSRLDAAAGRPEASPPAAARALASALLDPLFTCLDQRGLDPRDMGAVAILPASIGRRPRLLLRKLFRARGFPRLVFVPREIAAAMALGEEASAIRNLVLDVDEEDLGVYEVVLESKSGNRVYRTLRTRWIRDLGWAHWVERLAAALHDQKSAPADELPVRLDRAWIGLAGGPYSTDLPGAPPLRVTLGLLDEILLGLGEGVANDLALRLSAPSEAAPGHPAVALGTACSLGRLQEGLLTAAGGVQPAAVGHVPPLERCARGVAAALLWAAEDPLRTLEIRSRGGLRLDTLRGEALEVVPPDLLPVAPGERRRIRRRFSVQGVPGNGTPLGLHLLYGLASEAEANHPVSTLHLEVSPQLPQSRRTLEIELDVRRCGCGRRISGTARASLDGFSGSCRLQIEDIALLHEIVESDRPSSNTTKVTP